MRPQLDLGLLKDTVAQFNADKVPRMAAALSYTTVFAIAPMFIVIIAIVGTSLAFAGAAGHGSVEDQLIAAVRRSAGDQAAGTVRDLVSAGFAHRGASIAAQVFGWLMLVVGAGGLFAALQDALNSIWHVTPAKRGLWLIVRDRATSFGMLFAAGFVLLVTTAINAAIAVVAARFVALLPFPGAAAAFTLANWILSIAAIGLLFALMYKYLPDAEIAWRDVWTGALCTAVLFVAGQSLIALYLGRAGIASAYGAAGSLLVVLLWIYYSSLILLFGAELTRAYAQRHGSRSGAGAEGASTIAA